MSGTHDPLEAILARRLVFVTGKGGTGKTTVAAALARLAAARGRLAVGVELAGFEGLGEALAGGAPPHAGGRDPVPIGPNLAYLRLEPLDALAEYLELQIRPRALVALAVRNAGFRRLLDAAPGWRELITLGKLWYLATRTDGSGRPRWPLLVVDAPATGHGLALLSVPRVVIETVRMGPLRRHTEWVEQLLEDPERTVVVPVTILEELAVRETVELAARARAMGLALGPVIANAVEPALLDPPDPELEEALARIGDGAELPPLACPAAVRVCLERARARARAQAAQLEALRAALPAPDLLVPYVLERPHDPASRIEGVMRALEEAARAAAAAAEDAGARRPPAGGGPRPAAERAR